MSAPDKLDFYAAKLRLDKDYTKPDDPQFLCGFCGEIHSKSKPPCDEWHQAALKVFRKQLKKAVDD